MVVSVARLECSCFPANSSGLKLTGQQVSKPEAPSELTELGMCFSDVAVELPFTLMHPKPKEEPPHREVPESETPVDTNLIELDTNDDDFARQRLKGMKDDKDEEDDGTGSPHLNNR